MSGYDAFDYHFDEDSENVKPNVNAAPISSTESPKSFKKLLSPEEDTVFLSNPVSYLQKVRY